MNKENLRKTIEEAVKTKYAVFSSFNGDGIGEMNSLINLLVSLLEEKTLVLDLEKPSNKTDEIMFPFIEKYL